MAKKVDQLKWAAEAQATNLRDLAEIMREATRDWGQDRRTLVAGWAALLDDYAGVLTKAVTATDRRFTRGAVAGATVIAGVILSGFGEEIGADWYHELRGDQQEQITRCYESIIETNSTLNVSVENWNPNDRSPTAAPEANPASSAYGAGAYGSMTYGDDAAIGTPVRAVAHVPSADLRSLRPQPVQGTASVSAQVHLASGLGTAGTPDAQALGDAAAPT